MRVLLFSLLVFFAALPAFSQMGGSDMGRAPVAPNESESTLSPVDHLSQELKKPRWWRRTHEKTPVRQLAYAQGLRSEGKLKHSAKAFNALVHQWHDTDEAVIAQLALADVLLEMKKLDRAFSEYQYLVDHYPGQFSLDYVVTQQVAITRLVLEQTSDEGSLSGIFKSPDVALPMLERVVLNAPEWVETPGVRYTRASLLEQLGRLDEAVKAYEEVQQYHPRSPEATQAAYRKGACLGGLADRSPRDEKLCRAALGASEQYLARYPQGVDREAAQARATQMRERLAAMAYQRAHYYDVTANRPEAALVAYRTYLDRFPFSADADTARARVKKLEEASQVAVPEGPNPEGE